MHDDGPEVYPRGDAMTLWLMVPLMVAAGASTLSESMREYCRCRGEETNAEKPVMMGLSSDIFGETCDDVFASELARRVPPKLTVIVMAYLPSLLWRLERLVCMYATRADHVVDKILVAWNGPADVVSNANFSCVRFESRTRRRSLWTNSTTSMTVEIIEEERNTLLNRYRHSSLASTDAVLLQDDDVFHSPAALRAFAWMHEAAPLQILGVPPERDYEHRPDAPEKYRYAYVFHPKGGPYSFLLGQTSVLSRKYLASFLDHAPRSSLAYILSNKPTCEDLTLHFHVANATGLPPAVFHDLTPTLIHGPRSAQMHSSVSKKVWNKRRERCLERLVKEFGGKMPLVKSECRLAGNFSVSTDPVLSEAYFPLRFPQGDDAAPPRKRRRRNRRKKKLAEEQREND